MEETTTHTPMEYLRILFRRKWYIVVPTFAGLILGICAGMLLPKSYRSSTLILVEEGKTDNPLFSNIAVSSTMPQRIQTIRESIVSWNSLTELVKRLKLDADVKTPYAFEQLIYRIHRSIAIGLRGGNIIELSYVDRDPITTQAVVKNITDILIERNVKIQNDETSDAIKFIEEQLHVYLGKIKSAEIAELKDQLNTLLIDSTEQHPAVKNLRDQINRKMEDLKAQNLQYDENAKLSLTTTKPIVDEIKKSLDTISQKGTTPIAPDAPGAAAPAADTDIYKVMLLDKLDTVMSRDVKVNESIYNTLLQRLETAKITQRLQSSKEGTKYTILDPPRVPLYPTSPNKPLVIVMGLILGCGAGVAWIFLMEFFDKSFIDIQEASSFLGMPLMGAISRIVTAEEVEENRQRQRWLLFWMAAIGVLILSFAFMLSQILK